MTCYEVQSNQGQLQLVNGQFGCFNEFHIFKRRHLNGSESVSEASDTRACLCVPLNV